MTDILPVLLEIEAAATKEYESATNLEHHRSVERILAAIGKHRTPLMPPRIDLADIGFAGSVSAEARREMAARDRRASIVPL